MELAKRLGEGRATTDQSKGTGRPEQLAPLLQEVQRPQGEHPPTEHAAERAPDVLKGECPLHAKAGHGTRRRVSSGHDKTMIAQLNCMYYAQTLCGSF